MVKAKPEMRVVGSRGATVVLDGDHGFGQVVGAEGVVQWLREHRSCRQTQASRLRVG